MRERPFSSSAFPAANCSDCEAVVLTYLALDPCGDLVRHCVQCDRPLISTIRALSAEELEERGYAIQTPRARSARGCGGGCGCAVKAN